MKFTFRSIGLLALCLVVVPASGAAQRGQPSNPNAPPRVTVYCDPCTVEAGKTTALHAYAEDPNRKPLTVRWSASSGTFANAAERTTEWTAPGQEGKVQITAVADNGSARASNTVTITVRPPRKD